MDCFLHKNRPRHRTILSAWVIIFILPLVILSSLSLVKISKAQVGKTEIVNQVESLYNEGRFRDAELAALRALQEPIGLAFVDRGLLHRALGFTYVAMGENDKARSQFTEWLILDPLAQLDSVYVSPKIISVFQQAKTALKEMHKPTRDPSGLKIQLSAVKRSLLFPGLGQLYIGKTAKGVAMFASEMFLLGAFAYCQVQYNQARDDYMLERNPANMQKAYDRYNNFNRARYGTLFIAAGVYLYSLYDAITIPPTSSIEPSIGMTVSPNLNRALTLTFRL